LIKHCKTPNQRQQLANWSLDFIPILLAEYNKLPGGHYGPLFDEKNKPAPLTGWLFLFLFVFICFYLFLFVFICFYLFLFVFICFHLFSFVFICFHLFLFVFICFYLFLFVFICFVLKTKNI
jgi:hypothetical protein